MQATRLVLNGGVGAAGRDSRCTVRASAIVAWRAQVGHPQKLNVLRRHESQHVGQSSAADVFLFYGVLPCSMQGRRMIIVIQSGLQTLIQKNSHSIIITQMIKVNVQKLKN